MGKEKAADGLKATKTEANTSTRNGGPKKRALGIKEPEEQDVMWKLKVRWRSHGCRGWFVVGLPTEGYGWSA